MDVRSGRGGDGGRPGQPHRGRSAVLLWVLGGLAALALVAGAVAGALREPAQLAPGSPEGVTQAYLQAVFDHRYADAHVRFSAATAARCSLAELRHAWVPESLTVSLDDVRSGGGEAEVWVRIRAVAGPGPFGAGGYSSREVFTLVEEDGSWTLTGAPWPLLDCRGR